MDKDIKYIIENKLNFNPVDYSDEEPDLIDKETVSNLTYKYKYFPKTKEELQQIIIEKLKENIKYPYLNDIDISEISDMNSLFSSDYDDYLYQNDIDSSEIIKLDLSSWDTSNVTDMNHIFYNCESLKELNISTWDTSNVTDMKSMFTWCSSLKELDVSGWDTSKVTDMSLMFYWCSSLKVLDIFNWDTSNVTDMSFMFKGCSESIIPDWYKNRLTESKLNFNPVDYQDEESDIIDVQTVSQLNYKYHPKTKKELQEIIIEKLRENIKYPYLNDIDTSEITDMSDLFSNNHYYYLQKNGIDSIDIIKLDLSGWDTSRVIDMSGMFYRCKSLEKVNLFNFNTSKVTDMSEMFYECRSLEKLDLSSWSTSKVTDMSDMFSWCKSLKELNISNWDTSNVTNMRSMFYDCESLEKFDISNWNTSSVTTNMDQMFKKCNVSIIPDWYLKLNM